MVAEEAAIAIGADPSSFVAIASMATSLAIIVEVWV